jgi:hypothetical protein
MQKTDAQLWTTFKGDVEEWSAICLTSCLDQSVKAILASETLNSTSRASAVVARIIDLPGKHTYYIHILQTRMDSATRIQMAVDAEKVRR